MALKQQSPWRPKSIILRSFTALTAFFFITTILFTSVLTKISSCFSSSSFSTCFSSSPRWQAVQGPIASLFSSDPALKDKLLFRLLDIDASVFKSPELSSDEMAALIEKKAPNLPARFWEKYSNRGLAKNSTCAKFPSLYKLKYVDTHWQELQTVDGPFYLFGAYFDNRTLVEHAPSVRIIGQIAKIKINTTLFCQLWFEEHKEPAFAPIYEHRYLWNPAMGLYYNGVLQPYMLACQVPADFKHDVPQAVSVVERPCDMAKTNLKVFNNLPQSGHKEDFAVCVKGISLPFVDFSVRLVEWLELLFILGVNKVIFYDYDMHPNISKVLRYYEKQGRVEVIKLPLTGGQPNAFGLLNKYLSFISYGKDHQETVPYNDCFLKNINRYKYISIIDVDEIILPKNSSSWKTLMDVVVPKALNESQELTPSNYVMRHVYFLDDMGHGNETVPNVPRYMHMLQHVYRSPNYNKKTHYIKCFHDTERVLTVHNHFPLSCIGGKCASYFVDTADAQLQHYRKYCINGLVKVCEAEYRNNSVLDTTILRYKDTLISGVTEALLKMGFLDHFLKQNFDGAASLK
ncbi:uncharacterized protein LOC135197752 isoform X1 [Macrobrachium nipponense]|uniref:uncharacterized protein LOC135197752 isoform X1 n=1 Tax=Macrobrachium nipponense TaxID=159736 RepID=UPI0030C8C8F4